MNERTRHQLEQDGAGRRITWREMRALNRESARQAAARRLAVQTLRDRWVALGQNFVAQARAAGLKPMKYDEVGRGYRIGDLGTADYPGSDPSYSEWLQWKANHAIWYVLASGRITTSHGDHRVTWESGTARFEALVAQEWGFRLSA